MAVISPLPRLFDLHYDKRGMPVHGFAQRAATQVVFHDALVRDGLRPTQKDHLSPDSLRLAALRLRRWSPAAPTTLTSHVDAQLPLHSNAWVDMLVNPSDFLEKKDNEHHSDFLTDIWAKLLPWQDRFSPKNPPSPNELMHLVADITYRLDEFLAAYSDLQQSEQRQLAWAYSDYFTNFIMPAVTKLLEEALVFADLLLEDSSKRYNMQLPQGLVRLYNTLSTCAQDLRATPDDVWMATLVCRDTVVHELVRRFSDYHDFNALGIDSVSHHAAETSGIMRLRNLEMNLDDACQNLEREMLMGPITTKSCNRVAKLTSDWLDSLHALQQDQQKQTEISGSQLILLWWWETYFHKTLYSAFRLLACISPRQISSTTNLKRGLNKIYGSLIAIFSDCDANAMIFKDDLYGLNQVYLVPACYIMGSTLPAMDNETEGLMRAVEQTGTNVALIYSSTLSYHYFVMNLSNNPAVTTDDYFQALNDCNLLLTLSSPLATALLAELPRLTENATDMGHFIFLDQILPLVEGLAKALITKPPSFWGKDYDVLCNKCEMLFRKVIAIGNTLASLDDEDFQSWLDELEPQIGAVRIHLGLLEPDHVGILPDN